MEQVDTAAGRHPCEQQPQIPEMQNSGLPSDIEPIWLDLLVHVCFHVEQLSPAKEAAQTEANLVQTDQGRFDGCFHLMSHSLYVLTRIGLQPLRAEHSAGCDGTPKALVSSKVSRRQVRVCIQQTAT